MAYGVHLGILLMCLVQAEHVCCLWAAQAQRQNGNAYVGFSHQDSGFGGNYLQNEFRQASVSPGSAQSGSSNTETAVSGGSSRGLFSGGYKQTLSQPDKGGYTSVGFLQSSTASKPTNWRKLNRANPQMTKKQPFALSTAISGSSVSKYDKKTWPVQQSTPSTSEYLSASLQSPSRESYSNPASHHSAPAAAHTPAYYGQTSFSPPMSSSLFVGGAPPHRGPVQTRTSASAPARRVSSHRSNVASRPSSFSSPQNERTGNHLEDRKLYTSKLFPVNVGNTQESYKPTSTSHMKNSLLSVPVSDKPVAPAGFQPSHLQTSTSYTSTEQVPNSMDSLQASWNRRNPAQGAHNLPTSGVSGTGTSGLRYAPTRTHNIPQRYGGHTIRRLKDPERKEVSVRKPQQAYVAPQWPAPQQDYVAPQWPAPQQDYVAPQWPAPQQDYVTPQQPSASYKPQALRVHPETKWKRIRLRPAQ